MLHYNFNLIVKVRRSHHENRPVIYIIAKSVDRFKTIIIPYLHPSMYYKFGASK